MRKLTIFCLFLASFFRCFQTCHSCFNKKLFQSRTWQSVSLKMSVFPVEIAWQEVYRLSFHRQKATSYIPEYGKTQGKRWPFVIAGDVFEGTEDGLFPCWRRLLPPINAVQAMLKRRIFCTPWWLFVLMFSVSDDCVCTLFLAVFQSAVFSFWNIAATVRHWKSVCQPSAGLYVKVYVPACGVVAMRPALSFNSEKQLCNTAL